MTTANSQIKCFLCNTDTLDVGIMGKISFCSSCTSILYNSGITRDTLDLAVSNPKLYEEELRQFKRTVDTANQSTSEDDEE